MRDSIKLKLKNNLKSSNKKLLKQDIINNFPQLWNKLPVTVINENNTNTFKSKLHTYLLDLDWYSLTHHYNIHIATELSKWCTLYFDLILYILLNYKYSTTLFLQPKLLLNFYYLLLTNLTMSLYLPYTYNVQCTSYIYIIHIFSIHYPLYISPIYTICMAYIPHVQFPLTQLLYAYYYNYFDYLSYYLLYYFCYISLIILTLTSKNVKIGFSWINIYTHTHSLTHQSLTHVLTHSITNLLI